MGLQCRKGVNRYRVGQAAGPAMSAIPVSDVGPKATACRNMPIASFRTAENLAASRPRDPHYEA